MRLRVVIWLSLAMNLALLAALFLALRTYERNQLARQAALASTNAPPPSIRTNVVIRRQNFIWQQIESTDYRAFIQNLRDIGCPEPTIRDIIVAEVNSLYDRKRANEVLVPEQQWWKSDPDNQALQSALAQFEALDSERRALLTELLGPDWDNSEQAEQAEFNLRLDGPVLGRLPAKVKQSIRAIELQASQRQQAYLENQSRSGLAPDPAKLADLQGQTRRALAALLDPDAVEEYLLRYSATAQNLRATLRGFEVSRDEFRQLFREWDAIAEHARANHDSNTAMRREELAQRTEVAMKQILGPERFELFRYSRDPLFRQAQTSAQQIGAPAEAVLAIYQINQATEQEKRRISSDPALNLAERAAALAAAMSQQRESLRKLLGEESYQRYLDAHQGAN